MKSTKRVYRKLKLAEVSAKLDETYGNISATAKFFAVSRRTIYDFLASHPELETVLKDARGSLVDIAESKLFEAVQSGQPWAIMLVLKTLGRDRGYVDYAREQPSSLETLLRGLPVMMADELRNAIVIYQQQEANKPSGLLANGGA